MPMLEQILGFTDPRGMAATREKYAGKKQLTKNNHQVRRPGSMCVRVCMRACTHARARMHTYI